MAQVLQRVGMHIHVRAREAVEVLRLMRAPVPFQHTDVLMGVPLLGAEQEQIGFPWTLGIRHHDFRRDDRLHDDPFTALRVNSRTLDAAMGQG